jgi:hypothetical protein
MPMLYNDTEFTIETYDDDMALRAYVFKHYHNLMTPLERRTIEYGTPIVQVTDNWKVRRLYDFLEERDGQVSDEDVIAAFTIPYAKRKEMVIDRLISTCLDSVFINRCPKCNRIARTPAALQCMWCRHDWH